jgi:hypothetical protein
MGGMQEKMEQLEYKEEKIAQEGIQLVAPPSYSM